MTVYATAVGPLLTTNGANADLNVFGGSGCLHDADDTTYLQVFDLGSVPLGDVILDFSATDFSGTGAPATVWVQFHTRYQQTAGSPQGAPVFHMSFPTTPTAVLHTTPYSANGDPIIDAYSDTIAMDRTIFESFNEWLVTFDHDAAGACEFHLIETLMLFTSGPSTHAPLLRWPGGSETGPSRQWPRRLTRRPGTY